MAAQINDPLSAFAYPQANTQQTNNQSIPTDNAVVQSPVTPTPQTDGKVDQTAPISMQDTTVPVVPEPVSDVLPTTTDNSVVDNSLQEPTQEIKVEEKAEEKLEDVPQAVPETPVEEESESPLQALAKKLAKLREELIQETPDKQNEPVQEQSQQEVVDINQVEDKPVVDEVKQEAALPTSTPTPVMSEQDALDALNRAQEGAKLDETMSAPTTDLSSIPSIPSTPAETTEISQTTTDSSIPVETPVTEQLIPNPIDSVGVDTTEVSDQINTQTEASSTTSKLEQLYPEVVDTPTENVTQPPVIDNSPTSSNTVVDENDTTQADPMAAEQAALTAKYPLSINKIMDIAIERNASDIQISVGYPVMIRVDGILISVNDQIVSPANAEELILPTLSEQKKELLEVNREVDLAYSPLHNAEARFRINAYYSKNNMAAAFRLIPSKIRTIEELMLPPIYTQLTKMAQGLILVTGPTGHGKSTTLAAMIQAINLSRAVHIITIEDPIEYMFKPAQAVIDQREMHDDTHSWTVALKSALRQAPDVILVGEMRDYETIASAITLAETGHLVFATLHTNSAAQTVDRIIDVFPENQQAQIRTQLSNILEAVIAQRLLPIEGGGRRAVSEIMLGTPAVRNLIREGKTHQIDNVIRTSADVGMISLEQSLVKLVREGLITMEKAQEYAVHPEEVVRLLKS